MAQFARLKPVTILIVENEAIVLLEFAQWLTESGLIVLTAGDADEAIILLDTHPEIEVLMTDINMPGSMDGIRLAHHVRRRWPPLKIIVVSGMLQTELSDLPEGSVFLPKPIARPFLWRELSGLLNAADPGPNGPRTDLAA